MPDISKCKGEGCPIKETCYRFTAPPSKWRQSYFVESPIREDKSCDHFMEIWDKSKKMGELMRIKSNGDVYVDGELVDEEVILLIYEQLKAMRNGN